HDITLLHNPGKLNVVADTLSRAFGSLEPSSAADSDDDPETLAKMTEVKIGEGVQLDPALVPLHESTVTLGIVDSEAEEKFLAAERAAHRVVPLTPAELDDILQLRTQYLFSTQDMRDSHHLWICDRESGMITHRVDILHGFEPGELEFHADNLHDGQFAYAIQQVFSVQEPVKYDGPLDTCPYLPTSIQLDVKTPRILPPPSAGASPLPPEGLSSLRLASWNANSLSALCRKLRALVSTDGSTELPVLSGLIRYLDDREIDIACFQETMLSSSKKL
ncbi:hypothetical protein HDU96_005543, partial [Phlyctochytrium bullatum]